MEKSPLKCLKSVLNKSFNKYLLDFNGNIENISSFFDITIPNVLNWYYKTFPKEFKFESFIYDTVYRKENVHKNQLYILYRNTSFTPSLYHEYYTYSESKGNTLIILYNTEIFDSVSDSNIAVKITEGNNKPISYKSLDSLSKGNKKYFSIIPKRDLIASGLKDRPIFCYNIGNYKLEFSYNNK